MAHLTYYGGIFQSQCKMTYIKDILSQKQVLILVLIKNLNITLFSPFPYYLFPLYRFSLCK